MTSLRCCYKDPYVKHYTHPIHRDMGLVATAAAMFLGLLMRHVWPIRAGRKSKNEKHCGASTWRKLRSGALTLHELYEFSKSYVK